VENAAFDKDQGIHHLSLLQVHILVAFIVYVHISM